MYLITVDCFNYVMTFINDKRTIEEFLNNCQSKSTKSTYKITLKQFDHFCNEKYDTTGEAILNELSTPDKNGKTDTKIIIAFNAFVQWCLVAHPEITYYRGKNNCIKDTIHAKHPNTIKLYVSSLRVILDDVYETTITANKIRRNVKIPKAGRDKPVAFTPKEMRLFLDALSSDKKLQFMVLKDTGMRIQEFCKLKKSEVNITGKRIEITILANDTKTSQERICYITRETEPSFLRLYKSKKDNELMFGTNEDPEYSKGAYETAFADTRKKLAKTHPEFAEKYHSNGRHKKTIHSIRKFTSSQCAIAVDKSWGHAYIGHDEYLSQYIIDPEGEFLKNFIRSENHLMIYERIEVVDSDERVKTLENKLDKMQIDMSSLTELSEQITELKIKHTQKDMEIQQLQKSLGKN